MHAAGTCNVLRMTDEEIEQVVQCTGAVVCKFDAGEYVSKPGSLYKRIGIMLSGKARAEWIDPDGNKFILDTIEKGGIFGLVGCYQRKTQRKRSRDVCQRGRELRDTHDGREPTLKRMRTALRRPPKARLQRNVLPCQTKRRSGVEVLPHVTAEHEKKADVVPCRNEREREKPFVIPMNRQELADYLGVDRAAMSAELSE